MKKRINLLPGDGIGIEVTREAVKVLQGVGTLAGLSFDFEERLIGGACLDKSGLPIEEETITACQKADAVFLGAVGGPQWDNLPKDQRPEQGLLAIRKGLKLYTNLRPVDTYASLENASSLRPEVVNGIQLLVVRELTGGIYFGEPKFIEPLIDEERAVDSMVYTTSEIERIAHVAFRAAQKRRKKVISVDKANILVTSQLWRKTVDRIACEYPDVDLQHMLVDNCAMQLIRNPAQFDVLLTTNMFGDILSDEASMLTGSLGMLPSASLGDGPGLYEPVHGSAPDIAGQDKANPLAAIGSIAMMFRYSFDNELAAQSIRSAIQEVLNQGYRTADLWQEGCQKIRTTEMGDLVLSAAQRIFQSNSQK